MTFAISPARVTKGSYEINYYLFTLISSANWESGNPDIVKEQKESTKPPMVHPLVRSHPENGKKAIWFHKNKTDVVTGMDPNETQDFLAVLLENSLKDEFIYVHE
ncbi:TauD/TfdA family dioxygenase [Alphaproteobacteria bacterium]|jgi:taurine dioxygenase|nr:TauD/TfdA family dioxygenase [Alphaproteobacteria bacterium]